MIKNGLNSPRDIRILFLGQCIQYGYEGVSRYSTYPNVAASILMAQFPSFRFKFDFKYLHHPTGLKAILQHRLPLTRPRLTVITLPAMFAATHWRVNLVYQIAPELVDTARSFMRQIEAKVRGVDQTALGRHTLIDKTFAVQPPLSLDNYERLVETALSYAKQTSRRIILMGPGRFNDDTHEDYAVHSPQLWSSVNEMVARLGARLNLPVINMQDALTEYGGEVFISNNHRFSEFGHEVVGREVARVLAAELRMLALDEYAQTKL
ncbi:MAG: hypothetical protein AB1631_22010 [Acidobacteriota bacterium]